MRGTKKPLRRTEVFVSQEVTEHHEMALQPVTRVHGWWKAIKFTQLKKGDIFRLFDTDKHGVEKPDQKVKGQHVVNVALTDCKKQPPPMLGVVECIPVRGFNRRR